MSNKLHARSQRQKPLAIEHANAICYSGYRENQSPITKDYPSYEEVREDLQILSQNWKYLRLYDCSYHAELVFEVIEKEGFDFNVMLGCAIGAEESNSNCPWGANYPDKELAQNRLNNQAEIERAIELATRYPEIVFSVSVGNEASVDWTDHMVPVASLIAYVWRLKEKIQQPITFCENYVPWLDKLDSLVEEVDFISIHTYPVWEYQTIESALNYTKENYYAVAAHHPSKPVVITEAGWATASNGRGIDAWNANEELQARYYSELMEWTQHEKILTFVFEAFDESWKGSSEPLEPEKHWGLYNVDRTPKLVVKDLES